MDWLIDLVALSIYVYILSPELVFSVYPALALHVSVPVPVPGHCVMGTATQAGCGVDSVTSAKQLKDPKLQNNENLNPKPVWPV